MKSYLILTLIFGILLSYTTLGSIPNAYAANFTFTITCNDDGTSEIKLVNDEGQPLQKATVYTTKKISSTNFEKKFTSDENGIVKISSKDNTGFLKISKAGYTDQRIVLKTCVPLTSSASTNDAQIRIETSPDFSYLGEFWEYSCGSGLPIGVVIEGVVEDNGYIQLDVKSNGKLLGEERAKISSGNPKYLFCITYGDYLPYTFTVKNGNSEETISWRLNTENNDSEEELRKLPAEEKQYIEPQNIADKIIRIFDDKICVDEYCKYGDSIPVYFEGNIGINSNESFKLQITHCSKNYILYCIDYPGLENVVIAKISAENKGGGDFHAEWNIKKTHAEGLFQVEGIVGNRVIGPIGDSMYHVTNGIFNDLYYVFSNLSDLEINPITKENASIIFEIDYGQVGGVVNYEICAKKDIINPAFEILSDADRQNIVTEIELKNGECVKGKKMIMAKSPGSIVVPLGTSKSQTSDEIDELKKELEELKNLIKNQNKPKVPEWVKNNAKWWSDGQVDDSTFSQGIGFLIKNKVISVSSLPPQASAVAQEKVPDWIKNNAKWWADGMISEDDFLKGITYMVEKGIIRAQ